MSSPAEVVQAKKTTSTLLDGNHVFPPFYACYLLRSRATEKSQRTYVGSTPDPPRRIRQHNGEITQGAWKTSKFRPWEMQMIVFGFPSKLTALQFEWAWQHPELSRHLRSRDPVTGEDNGPIFRKDNKRNLMLRKALVALALLRSEPFSHLPLHVRCFNSVPHTLFTELASQTPTPLTGVARDLCLRTVVDNVLALPPLSPLVKISLDPGGVTGSIQKTRKRPLRNALPEEALSDITKLDLADKPFRTGDRVLGKWRTLQKRLRTVTPDCAICNSAIDVTDHLTFALCPATDTACLCITHLPCLAQASIMEQSDKLALLPRETQCPSCKVTVAWGAIIRSCYGRRGTAEQSDSDSSEE